MNVHRFRKLARWGFAGLPCLGLACAQLPMASPPSPLAPAVRSAPAAPSTFVPTSDSAANVRLSPEPVASTATNKQPIPVSLDAVMRLAEESNPQVASARAKVSTAFAERDLAAIRWVPDINVGVGYWRHDGGIQLQEGPNIYSSTGAVLGGTQINATYNPREYAFRQLTAARKIWQTNGEMAKISNEQLLDAASTYIDLLAAYSALAVSKDLDAKVVEVLEKAKLINRTSQDSVPTRLEVSRIEAEHGIQTQTQHKLQAQIDAAAAKLAYLLGLGEVAQIVPVDTQMAAFHLVDANISNETLVAQALSNGPGIRELEGILCVIQGGLALANGPSRWMPEVGVQVGEGLFGAGIGSTSSWNNRFDLGVQAKWNISDLFLADNKKAVAQSQLNEVQWTYQELRSKLTFGVSEARSTIQHTGTEFAVAEEQIKRAKEAVNLFGQLVDADRMQPRYGELMQTHKAVAMAQLNYVEIMREFDKAQLRLMILTGSKAATGEKVPTPK